jgi:hypothetical protein
MKILIVFLILISANSVVFAQAESECFQNDTLQGKQIVKFQTRENGVTGTFEFENGESELARAYKFTGTLGANGALRVRFENDELPDVSPSEMKSLNWTLLENDGGEILRIKFYGKNYETNKYADYFADFAPCEPNYDSLLKMATPVQFAKGKTAATVPLSFKNAADQKVFSLNVRRGQKLDIDATGCKISVYLPDGGLYELVEWESGGEKTFASSAIDRTTIKRIPQKGNYLIVLGKMAENTRPDAVTFKITN